MDPSMMLATPKSAMHTVPDRSTRMLPALMSLEGREERGDVPVNEIGVVEIAQASGCLFQNGSNDGLLEDTSAVWLRQVLR